VETGFASEGRRRGSPTGSDLGSPGFEALRQESRLMAGSPSGGARAAFLLFTCRFAFWERLLPSSYL
jgi:hypothetical protein